MPPLRGLARLFRLLLARLSFRAVRVAGREHLPPAGVVLFACTHRNGAVDGLVMEAVLARPLAIVGRNLTASPCLRPLLAGSIAIHRHPATPAENRENHRRLQDAARAAVAGRQVVMFPEGTSKLGPSLLPVRRGMAHLARLALKAAGEREVRIVPVGLHYARGFAFRSDVEVTFGPPLVVAAGEAGALDALTARIAHAMTGVAVCFRDAEEQRQGELFADIACYLQPGASHRTAALAYGSGGVTAALRQRFAAAVAGLDRHDLPPVLPKEGPAWELARLLLGAPLVVAALLGNLLPCLGAYLLARRLADDDNVVTLWRLLGGVPLWGLQLTIYGVTAAWFPAGGLAGLAGYGLVTLAGIGVYHRWRLALAATANRLSARRRQLAAANDVVRAWLQQQG